jgi:hypothetical protein
MTMWTLQALIVKTRPLDLWCVRAIALLLALAALADKSLAQAPFLKITSPSDGTVVSPGQTVVIVVKAAPGLTFAMVSIDGEYLLGWDRVLSAPPFRFSVEIPTKISAARKYRIFASGATAPGQGWNQIRSVWTLSLPHPFRSFE